MRVVAAQKAFIGMSRDSQKPASEFKIALDLRITRSTMRHAQSPKSKESSYIGESRAPPRRAGAIGPKDRRRTPRAKRAAHRRKVPRSQIDLGDARDAIHDALSREL